MDKKLVDAFNKQLNSELYSAYLYLSMVSYFESINLDGFSKWMKLQAKEEFSHAMKIFEFLNDRGQRAVLSAVAKPPAEFSSPQDAFKKTLEHEKKVTALIEELYTLAKKVDDNSAAVMLQWFITEQVEEEKNASTILEKLKLIKLGSEALFMFDAVMGKREG